mgnify:CR=1 FL=1
MTANLAGFQRVKALLDVDQSTTSKCQPIPSTKNTPKRKIRR